MRVLIIILIIGYGYLSWGVPSKHHAMAHLSEHYAK